MRHIPLTPTTWAYLLMATLTVVGFLAPHIAQPEAYHHFADRRTLAGVPHFADVVSNIIFTVAGAVGLSQLRRLPEPLEGARTPLAVFFVGLALTGLGSSYYHWAPTSQSLFWDRLPMVLAFAGIIATFLTQRVSLRAGKVGMAWALGMGVAGLATSQVTGNLALYLTLQFGGLLGIVAGLCLLKKGPDTFPWWPLIGWYALAKILELGDTLVWDFTLHLVSGHTLKHLAAGMAGVAVVRVIASRSARPSRRLADNHGRTSCSP